MTKTAVGSRLVLFTQISVGFLRFRSHGLFEKFQQILQYNVLIFR